MDEETAAAIEDLKRRNKVLQDRLDAVDDLMGQWNYNGLDDLLRGGHGAQYFGANKIRADQYGLQVDARNTPVPRLFFVNGFQTNPLGPGAGPIRGEVTGDVSDTVINTAISSKADGSNIATLTVTAGNSGATVKRISFNLSTFSGEFYADSSTVYFDVGTLLQLLDVAADPSTTLADGQIWYRTDTDKFRGRVNGATRNFLMDNEAMMKVSGSGYQVYPAAAAGVNPPSSGGAWTNGAYAEVVASTAAAIYITHVMITDTHSTAAEFEMDIATGAAGAETVVSTLPYNTPTASTNAVEMIPLTALIAVAASTRIALRARSSSTTATIDQIKLVYVRQQDLVSL